MVIIAFWALVRKPIGLLSQCGPWNDRKYKPITAAGGHCLDFSNMIEGLAFLKGLHAFLPAKQMTHFPRRLKSNTPLSVLFYLLFPLFDLCVNMSLNHTVVLYAEIRISV